MKYIIILGLLALVALANLTSALAAEIKCVYLQPVTQTAHAPYDYVTNYHVEGVITKEAAKLLIVSREYGVKLENGIWVTDYRKKGNVHVDVDKRSTFRLAKVNGEYSVYTTTYQSDRTGVFQYNLAFILRNVAVVPYRFEAIYAKSSSTDDAPFHQKIRLDCVII